MSKVMDRMKEIVSELPQDYFDNMVGNIKFIWTEYTCETCQKGYSVDEIHQVESKKSNKP